MPVRPTPEHGSPEICPAGFCSPYTAVLLAGGQGTRMGGADKGLQLFRGQPLAAHALARLRAQSCPPAALLISANRHHARYAALARRAGGAPVLADSLPGHAGPLAGMLTALHACRTPWLLAVPCDVPGFPLDLAARLLAAQMVTRRPAAYVQADSGSGPRAQPTFCLLARNVAPTLAAYLHDGGRKVMDWLARIGASAVSFADAPPAFANANTAEALHQLECQPFTRPQGDTPCPTPPSTPPKT